MRIKYDESVDALAISLVGRVRSAKTKAIAEGINLDYDVGGNLVAIEVLDASRFMRRKQLRKLDVEAIHEHSAQ